MAQKRTLDSFFAPNPKKQRDDSEGSAATALQSKHAAYPFPIPHFPESILSQVSSFPAKDGKVMKNEPDLDLLYYQPYMPSALARSIFSFLRAELPFYRVEYTIKRGGIDTQIKTPRWTTVFGLDDTSRFDDDGHVIDKANGANVQDRRYSRIQPRPIPSCLAALRRSTEAATGCTFNFCLVNYYSNGSDSITYHSDDERFLGPDPGIASFSFGAQRDFLLKHKTAPGKSIKLALGSGDMVLMRGKTQANWLHSIPKRTGKNMEDGGRINITFRKAVTRDGTENYYNYNVGTGLVYKWDGIAREMKLWEKDA